jgi:hypothetical protein
MSGIQRVRGHETEIVYFLMSSFSNERQTLMMSDFILSHRGPAGVKRGAQMKVARFSHRRVVVG